jgi:hypothetical protein
MFSYDSVLVEAVRTPIQDIAGVLRAMSAIDAACVDTDGLKWFNWLYMTVTRAVEARIAVGGFTDADWLSELDVQFAKLYFGALEAFLTGAECPECWHVLFDRRERQEIARVQFALAGINAHIDHDLPEAIFIACQKLQVTPQHGTGQYSDYTALNSTLDSLIGEAKRALNVRLPGDPLPPVSHLEDLIASWGVTAARGNAWNNAEILWQLQATPLVAQGLLKSLDALTSFASKALLVPVP